MDCVFCQISEGAAPAHKVWEDAHHLAFLSIYPNTEGVTVVIPRRHSDSYVFNNPQTDVEELMRAAREVADILVKKFLSADRVALVFEGCGVNHLHVKLFPLHGTAFISKEGSSNASLPTTKYDRYPGYVSTHDAARASDDTLSKLAAFLRA